MGPNPISLSLHLLCGVKEKGFLSERRPRTFVCVREVGSMISLNHVNKIE